MNWSYRGYGDIKKADEIINIKPSLGCPHCKFLAELFKDDEIKNNREYWIMTEIFVYLHGGKDYCNYNKEQSHP